MKYSYVIAFTIVVITYGCRNHYSNSKKYDLSDNTELKNKVFDQIASNRDLFNEFMNKMMENGQVKDWTLENRSIVQLMFNSDNLHFIMKNDDALSSYMLENMMKAIQQDSALLSQWNEMIRDHDHMEMMSLQKNIKKR